MKPGDAVPPTPGIGAELAELVDGVEVHELGIEPGDTMSAGRMITLLKQVSPDTPVYAFDRDATGVRCRRIVRLFLSIDPQLLVVW